MTRSVWLLLLSALITILSVQGYLWARGIRPSKRNSLWEHLTWEMIPKDEQTSNYVRQRLLGVILVLPTTVLLLNLIFEGSNSVVVQVLVLLFVPHRV